MNSSTLRFAAVPLAVVALSLSAVSCGDDSDGDSNSDSVTVTEVWVREPAEGQTNSAAYGVISNGSDADVILVEAAVPVTGKVEIHETSMNDDGTMSMQEREDGFVIAAGESLTLEPGGAHVMILGVDASEFGDGFDVKFVFEGANSVTAYAEVRELTADGMDGMDEEMEMDEEMDDES